MSHPKATGDRHSANQKLMTPMRLWYECLKAAGRVLLRPRLPGEGRRSP